MQNKIILVVCGIVVIIAIVFLAFYVLKDNSFDNTVDNHVSAALVQPEVELSIEPESVTNKKVTIFVKASVSQGKIESITLPNGKVENSANVEYKVSENGEYNFIVATEAGINVTKSITVNNISDVSADKPYIPEGFSHVKGTKVETGYIIEDSNGNEYVWVPVKTGKLTRNTIDNDQYEEIDDSVTDFYNSVSKYYGF